LPQGRTTPLVGGLGSGKTIFALQFLAHGAPAAKTRQGSSSFEESTAFWSTQIQFAELATAQQ
jgi:circadian clock protein KaiC